LKPSATLLWWRSLWICTEAWLARRQHADYGHTVNGSRLIALPLISQPGRPAPLYAEPTPHREH